METQYVASGPVTVYGIFFVAALATIWWLARRNAARSGIDGSHIDFIFPVALVVGIAGGWLVSLAMPGDWQLAGPALQVDVRIRMYVVVLFAAAVVFVYSRIASLSFRRLLDAFAVPMLSGIVVARFGCFYAGCCWGDIAAPGSTLAGLATTQVGVQVQTLHWLSGDWVASAVQYGPGTFAWQQHLALGLIAPDAELSLPVHPVQLYEAALVAIAILLLRRLRPGEGSAGQVALAAIIAYAAITFVVEYLRADGVLAFGNLTITQVQSLPLAALAATALWFSARRRTA